MATIKKFEDIEAWQVARELSKRVYEASCRGKFNRDYKFKDQINAAAGSGMDNIAEGFGRGGRNEFVNFLSIFLRLAQRSQITTLPRFRQAVYYARRI